MDSYSHEVQLMAMDYKALYVYKLSVNSQEEPPHLRDIRHICAVPQASST